MIIFTNWSLSQEEGISVSLPFYESGNNKVLQHIHKHFSIFSNMDHTHITDNTSLLFN